MNQIRSEIHKYRIKDCFARFLNANGNGESPNVVLIFLAASFLRWAIESLRHYFISLFLAMRTMLRAHFKNQLASIAKTNDTKERNQYGVQLFLLDSRFKNVPIPYSNHFHFADWNGFKARISVRVLNCVPKVLIISIGFWRSDGNQSHFPLRCRQSSMPFLYSADLERESVSVWVKGTEWWKCRQRLYLLCGAVMHTRVRIWMR